MKHAPTSLLLLASLTTLVVGGCDEEPQDREMRAVEDDAEDTDEWDESSGDVEFAGGVWEESVRRTFPDVRGHWSCSASMHTGTILQDSNAWGEFVPAGTQRTVATFTINCRNPRLIIGYLSRHGVERSRTYRLNGFVDMNLPEVTADTAPDETAITATMCVEDDRGRDWCANMFR